MLNGFRHALQTFATHQLLSPRAGQERDALIAEAVFHAGRLGARPLHPLQVNPEKTRVVLLCDHPRHGRCVLKTVSGQASSGLAAGHVESLRRAHARDAGLFPALYDLGSTWSLERYIDGTTLHRLPSADWDGVDLVAFFARLRGFGRNDVAAEPIRGDECLRIVFAFVRKILQAAQYAVRAVRPWNASDFAFPSGKRAGLDRLLEEAARAALPRSLVFFDLTPANIVRERDTGQLLVVDIEHLKEGFFGFDALWLLAMLTRAQCPPDVLEDVFEKIHADDFTGAPGSEGLMRSMFAFLLDVLGSYEGMRRRRRINRLHQRIRAGLAGGTPRLGHLPADAGTRKLSSR